MGRQGQSFQDATERDPCPICGAHKRCWRSRDGRTWRCYRSPTWGTLAGRRTVDGMGEGWTFTVGTGAAAPPTPAPPPLAADLAEPDTRNAVYRAMLSALPLSPAHRNSLRARGLPDSEIGRRQYGSLPLEGRARVARELADRFGGDTLAGVPGLVLKDSDRRPGRRFWTLAGSPGLLVPVRDLASRTVALRVRLDAPPPGAGKYRWISSTASGGPGPGAIPHVPLDGPKGRDPDRVRLTEGELKADVATHLDPDRVLTVSVPGAGLWRQAFPILAALGVGTVRLAFDLDSRTNPDVARAQWEAATALDSAGYNLERDLWE